MQHEEGLAPHQTIIRSAPVGQEKLPIIESTQLIVAFDPGFVNLGVVVFSMTQKDKKHQIKFVKALTLCVAVESGIENFTCSELRHGVDFAMNQLRNAIGQDLWNDGVPRAAVIEQQYINPYVGNTSGLMVGHKLKMLEQTLTCQTANAGFQTFSIQIQTVRRFWNMPKEKRAYTEKKKYAYEYVQKNYGPLVEDDHQADAFLMMLTWIEQVFPGQEKEYDFPSPELMKCDRASALERMKYLKGQLTIEH